MSELNIGKELKSEIKIDMNNRKSIIVIKSKRNLVTVYEERLDIALIEHANCLNINGRCFDGKIKDGVINYIYEQIKSGSKFIDISDYIS